MRRNSPSIASIRNHQGILHCPRVLSLDKAGQAILAVIATGKMIGIDRLALGEDAPLVALNASAEGVIGTDSEEQVGAFPLKAAVEAVALVLTIDSFEERERETGDLAGLPEPVLYHACQCGGDRIFVHRCQRLALYAQNLKGADQNPVKDDEYLGLQLRMGKLGRRGVAGIASLLLEGAGHFFGLGGRNASR